MTKNEETKKADSKVKEIIAEIDKENSFLLSGGAGSGKTYSLVETVKELNKRKKTSFACITYTNVAADEIKKRLKNEDINLYSDTIHKFLWFIIRKYQLEIREAILVLIASGEIKCDDKDKKEFKDKKQNLEIEYGDYGSFKKEYPKNKIEDFEKWVFGHDDLLKISFYIFDKYKKVSKIISDKYDFIFIDEYQDTDEKVIKIFLEKIISNKGKSNIVIGLFGDSLQQIYDGSVGAVDEYIEDKTIVEIIKEDNLRSSKDIIKVINNIRNDGLEQDYAEAEDKKRENGLIKFIYSKDKKNVDEIKKDDVFKNFDFENSKETKELYLTNKLISKKLGFGGLFEIYRRYGKTWPVNYLFLDKMHSFEKYLFSLVKIYSLFKDTKRHYELIQELKTHGRLIWSIQEKIDIIKDFKSVILDGKNIIEVRESFDENKIITNSYKSLRGNSIERIKKNKKMKSTEVLKKDIEKEDKFFEEIEKINFQEVDAWFNYRKNKTPYSTQHGVKGEEYKSVFVYMDNGGWNNYNFEKMFLENGEIAKKTRKIFYVSCSRAKENLVVYMENPSDKVIEKAKEWFNGEVEEI